MLKGKDIIISENGKAISASRSCEIYTGCDFKETSSALTGAWRNHVPGRKTWRVTVSYLLMSVSDKLLHIGDEVELSVQVNSERLTGMAICIDCKVTGTVGNLMQGSWSFIGNGELC